jgi:hypothetical protein
MSLNLEAGEGRCEEASPQSSRFFFITIANTECAKLACTTM